MCFDVPSEAVARFTYVLVLYLLAYRRRYVDSNLLLDTASTLYLHMKHSASAAILHANKNTASAAVYPLKKTASAAVYPLKKTASAASQCNKYGTLPTPVGSLRKCKCHHAVQLKSNLIDE